MIKRGLVPSGERSRTVEGFTLVELLVAASLLTLVMMITTMALGAGLKDWRRKVTFCKREQLKQIIVSRMVLEMREAREILPISDQNKMVLQSGFDQIEYSLTNSKIKRRKNKYVAYLTDKNELESLSFVYQNSREVLVSLSAVTFEVRLRNI